MTQERRQVIREVVTLPLTWQTVPVTITMQEILEQLLGTQAAELLTALQPVQSELTNFYAAQSEPARPDHGKNRVADYRAAVQDREYSRALNLLNTKLDMLVQHAVYPTPAQAHELCLSSQGCTLPSAAAQLSAGQRVALHLLLPGRQHVICSGLLQQDSAQVNRVVFDTFHAEGERLLSRYLLLKRSPA